MVLLGHGHFEEGWQEYEWRWVQHNFARRQFTQPLWEGSDLYGKTLLLHAEQGLGDALHFLRYGAWSSSAAARCLLNANPNCWVAGRVFRGRSSCWHEDCRCRRSTSRAPLLSLPGIFQTNLGNMPGAVPYLRAETKLVIHWRRKMSAVRCLASKEASPGVGHRAPHDRRQLLVGVAWQGNPTNPGDRHRSIPLQFFRRLADVRGVQLISLQKGPGTDQLRKLGGQFPVVNLASTLDETTGAFVDSAAVMINLDLVISSDTAIPHLAGALGVPVWLALSLAPDWHWLLHREDSPWYPGMRLFRQKQLGDWQEVFDRIAEELARLPMDEAPMKHD